MKSEKIFDAITDIDDELISFSEKYKFRKKKNNVLKAVISLAAAFAVLISSGLIIRNFDFDIFNQSNETAVGENPTEENNTSPDNNKNTGIPEAPVGALQMTLVKAVYPERTKYPVVDDNYYNSDEFDKWNEEERQRWGIKFDDESVNSFSFKLIKETLTGKEGENKAVSPLNIYMALCVLAETTGGNSRDQILSLLGVSSIEELRELAGKLWTKNYRNDGAMQSILANSLWLSDSLNYNTDTLNIISENYFASSFSGKMGSPEYNKMLNYWISEQTGGLLSPDIEMDPQTLLGIASTLLFNSKWQNEFNPKNTERGIFNAPSGDREADFMKSTQSMQYFFGDKFSAISLELDIGGKMWFILPDEGVSADYIFEDSELQQLLSIKGNAQDQYKKSKHIRVNMSIPKFDIECKTDIMKNLKNLGITDVMDSSLADFSPLLGDNSGAFVGKAEHGVRVMADEEGISAAAYTVILECGSAMPPDEIVDFTLDRPFAFAVTFDYNTILFAGIVNEI